MPPQFKPPGMVSINLLVDKYGRPVLSFRYDQYTITLPDGSQAELHQGQTIELVDGTLWNPIMLKGENPLRLGICELCRYPSWWSGEPPTHGLCALQNIRICVCGQPTCPRHGQDRDRIWRCQRCARRFRQVQPVKQFGLGLLKWMFFKGG